MSWWKDAAGTVGREGDLCIRIRSIGEEKDYILTLSFLDDVEFSPYTTKYFRYP